MKILLKIWFYGGIFIGTFIGFVSHPKADELVKSEDFRKIMENPDEISEQAVCRMWFQIVFGILWFIGWPVFLPCAFYKAFKK